MYLTEPICRVENEGMDRNHGTGKEMFPQRETGGGVQGGAKVTAQMAAGRTCIIRETGFYELHAERSQGDLIF